MTQKKSANARRYIEVYERALQQYIDSCHTYFENKNMKTRRVWQQSIAKTLSAYCDAIVIKGNQSIALDWQIVADLSNAMETTLDGKDAELFHVVPSDRYNWKMQFAKAIAVGYIAKAKTKENQQTRKQWIMEQYGISRSLINEWIRNTTPHNYDEKIDGTILSHLIDYYRKNKLKGRKRKP